MRGVIMAEICMRIKNLRENKSLIQKQVANYLGISQQAYSHYELDKRELPSRHAVNLAKLYHVSSDYILCIESQYADCLDLETSFVQGITLREVILKLERLDNANRQEAVRYLSYLISTQGKKK